MAMRTLLFLGLVAGLIAGCAGPEDLPPLEQDGVPTEAYRLDAGDQLHVTVFNQEQLTGNYQVGANGAISVPLIGRANELTYRHMEIRGVGLVDVSSLFGIRAVHSGDAVVAPSTTRRLIDRFAPLFPADDGPAPPDLACLTGREREVLAHVAQGLSNAEIAGRLFVSEATVKTHVGRVLAKLGLRDRVQAVVFAYETGLVKARGAG